MDKFVLNLLLVALISGFVVVGIIFNKWFFIGAGITYIGMILETIFSSTNKYLLNIKPYNQAIEMLNQLRIEAPAYKFKI